MIHKGKYASQNELCQNLLVPGLCPEACAATIKGREDLLCDQLARALVFAAYGCGVDDHFFMMWHFFMA